MPKPPSKRSPRKRGDRKPRRQAVVLPAPLSRPIGVLWWLLCVLTVAVAAFPVAATRVMNDETVTGAFFAPLLLWFGAATLAFWWARPKAYSGDRAFVALTMLLLGLGVVLQLRLGTWEESWTAWRAYAPLLAGLLGFYFGERLLSSDTLARWLPRLQWGFWLGALGVLGLLFLFGRSYRGGTFLPGNINPTELVKLCLIAFAAAWLPPRVEAFSRTLFGLPMPPMREAIALALVWGIPLLGAVAVRDLGLVLILCLTLVLMLTVLTRRLGWLVLGGGAAVAAGWAVRLVSAHTRARFDVWLNPFQDPLGKGWQIGQSLCAHYAGGLWGTGLGEGMPRTVPIVSSDFVYAAIAEEWGLVGCALLLGLYWLWLGRIARAGADHASPCLRLLGPGIAAVLGVQILLNIGGVTKALPMTGITLPFLSQGGFSLLTVLLLCGLVAALSKRTTAR